jgi:hypothetical protein
MYVEKDVLIIICLCHFSLRECISRQKWKVYIRVDLLYQKLQKFVFHEFWPSYEGGKQLKTDPSVKSSTFCEGGGIKVDKYVNAYFIDFEISIAWAFEWFLVVFVISYFFIFGFYIDFVYNSPKTLNKKA